MVKSKFASAVITALSFCVLIAPAKASDSVERWNTAMTDYAAGQPPPGIPPFVESRGYAMAHIAMLDALRAARASTLPANANAAIAAAAHDVLASVFAPFGPNSFDDIYQTELTNIPNGPAETRGVSLGNKQRLRCSRPEVMRTSSPHWGRRTLPARSPAITRRHHP